MDEALHNAKVELQRADHLIFVSLKYTRTVDVIKNIIGRLISTFDYCIEALLKHAKEQKKIPEVPELPRLRIDLMRTLYGTHELIPHFLEFYLLMKKVDKARFTRALEYRRHVTMTAHLDDEQVEINIDIITDYFEKTKEFYEMVLSLVGRGGKKEQ